MLPCELIISNYSYSSPFDISCNACNSMSLNSVLFTDKYSDLCKDTSAKFTFRKTHLVFKPDFIYPTFPAESINACSCSIYADQNYSMDVKTTDVRLDRYNLFELFYQGKNKPLIHKTKALSITSIIRW